MSSHNLKHEGYAPFDGGGLQRTEVHCHECSKTFVAELDFDITGNHVIECPNCGHEHFRWIEKGKITQSRWDSSNHKKPVARARSVWKSSVIKAQTSSVSAFIRDRWINKEW